MLFLRAATTWWCIFILIVFDLKLIFFSRYFYGPHVSIAIFSSFFKIIEILLSQEIGLLILKFTCYWYLACLKQFLRECSINYFLLLPLIFFTRTTKRGIYIIGAAMFSPWFKSNPKNLKKGRSLRFRVLGRIFFRNFN